MEEKYGQIAENTKINDSIYDCFSFLNDREQHKFVKKFRKQPHTEIQIMHTFCELLLGAYLMANNLLVENERGIYGKNPDWSILDSSSNIIAIVEMVYHHIDNKTNENIVAQLKSGKKAIGYWPNGNDPDNNRLYSHIHQKTIKYKDLVAKIQVPYVVAIFIDFKAVTDVQELKDCMMKGDQPLFQEYPDLSGVLQFEEANHGSYNFWFVENPFALRKITIPSGVFRRNDYGGHHI